MKCDTLKLYNELFGLIREEVFTSRYYEPHRYYHNIDHLNLILDFFQKNNTNDEELFIAGLFHDIIYNPKRDDNEERSAKLFDKHAKVHPMKQTIIDLILSTKNHEHNNPLNTIDMEYLSTKDDDRISNIELKIFKEYQFYNVGDFVKGRRTFLANNAIDSYYQKARMSKYNIAVYAGSFNPIHIGHQSVIEQAEQIFDKVIIAIGTNPEKESSDYPATCFTVAPSFPFHEIIK
jgi:cytidyltransferase-like protein